MPALSRLASTALIAGALAVGLSACAERPGEVPASAPLVSEGTGRLAYQAGQPGTVYVWDQWQDRLLYSGSLEKGQTLTVDTKTGDLLVDGKVVAERVVRGGNNNRIFFQPETTSQTRP